MKRLSESHNPYEAPNVEYVSDHRQAVASSATSSIWRIAAGVIPMPLALLLDNLFSADASERLPFVIIGHIILWPYSLVWAIVVAFINEYIVNPYIKFSAIAVPVGTLLIGLVAALTSGFIALSNHDGVGCTKDLQIRTATSPSTRIPFPSFQLSARMLQRSGYRNAGLTVPS